MGNFKELLQRRNLLVAFAVTSVTVFFFTNTYGQEAIKLLEPRLNKGKLLMQALKERETRREFSSKELPLEVLSDLLWAADGINRPASGKRTAPSAMNMQEIDIYVAKADGLYIYDAKKQGLTLVLSQDIRPFTGKQDFVSKAPVNLIFVADFSKMGKTTEANRDIYAAMDAAFISQNVYLYCASEGLATVVRGWFDEQALKIAMKLRPDQRVILTQTVGYPER